MVTSLVTDGRVVVPSPHGQGHIYKRENGSFHVLIYAGRHPHRQRAVDHRDCPHPERGGVAAHAALCEVDRGRPAGGGKTTVQDRRPWEMEP
jgi:hypothetical protein